MARSDPAGVGPGHHFAVRGISGGVGPQVAGTLRGVGHVDVNQVSFGLPDGRPLLDEVTFRVGEGATAALIGPNGTGKTTLLRIIAGDLAPDSGAVTRDGGLGVMRQFVGSLRDSTSLRDLLVSVASAPIRTAAQALEGAELAMMEHEDEPTQMR